MPNADWIWKMTLSVRGDIHVLEGRMDAHPGDTPATIRAEILDGTHDLYRDSDGQFNVVDFTLAQVS